MALHLELLTYQHAVRVLLDSGYTLLASGDWSLVFQMPDHERVVRITPYDPANLVFAELCASNPHPNLPQVLSIRQLQRNGFVVEMPKYQRRECHEQQTFLDLVQYAMASADASTCELGSLCRIMEAGLRQAEALPYFDGMDWNPENVVFDGTTPKFVDAFNIRGSRITALLKEGEPVDLDAETVADFLSIPFHSAGLEKNGAS